MEKNILQIAPRKYEQPLAILLIVNIFLTLKAGKVLSPEGTLYANAGCSPADKQSSVTKPRSGVIKQVWDNHS